MTMACTRASRRAAGRQRRSAIVDFCRQQPLGAVSFVVIFVMMFAGIFSPWVAPYDPLQISFDPAESLAPPSAEHWFGTDAFGRDIFSRIIYGSRTAMVIGFTSSFVGSTLGAVLGVASAYFGGRDRRLDPALRRHPAGVSRSSCWRWSWSRRCARR